MTKWMVIVGGPNGAGKSSLVNALLGSFESQSYVKLNADERTLALRAQGEKGTVAEINLLAAQQTDAQVARHIKEGKSFYLETVLSSGKYQDDVLLAKDKGFKIAVIYVTVPSADISVARVNLRAKEGGHDVEPARVIMRYEKSHREAEWFAAQADVFYAIDTSPLVGPPVLLAAKFPDGEILHTAKGVNSRVDNIVGGLKKTSQVSALRAG